MAEEKTPPSVTPEEDAKIGETPAVFSNKFYLTTVPLGLKITFAERYKVGKEHNVDPRCSVFLQHQDALVLHQLLTTFTNRINISREDASKRSEDG